MTDSELVTKLKVELRIAKSIVDSAFLMADALRYSDDEKIAAACSTIRIDLGSVLTDLQRDIDRLSKDFG